MKSRNCSDRAQPRRTRAIWLGLAVCAVLGTTSALAAPYTYTFHYKLVSGQGTATGSVTFDDALLAPNSQSTPCDLTQLISFDLHISGLPTSPSSTSFTKADLADWAVRTDSAGRFTDINFWMDSCTQNKVNADGYAIDGVAPFALAVIIQTGAQVAVFELQRPGIPALSTYGVVALALLVLLTGALLVARRLS